MQAGRFVFKPFFADVIVIINTIKIVEN